MLFQKVRVSWNVFPEKLFRLFYIRQDISLDHFAVILQRLFEMGDEHLWCFKDKKHRYVTDRELYAAWDECSLLSEARFSNLPEKSVFEYDYGEGWEFEVRKYKKTIEKDTDDNILMKEAAGAGIFEDNRYTLEAYLSGEADPNMRTDDENEGLYMPWNMELEKLGDFDAPADLEYLEDKGNSLFEEDGEDHDDIWSGYDRALLPTSSGSAGTLDVWQEFLNVREDRQANGSLPRNFDDFENLTSSPDDLYYLIDEMPDDLEIDEQLEDALNAMKQLREMFRFAEPEDMCIREHICYELSALQRFEEELEEASAFTEKYPENTAAQSMLLDAYDHCGKEKEAQQLIDRFMKAHPACNENSYQFYNFAADYYEDRNDRKQVKKLRRMLAEEDRRQMKYFEEDDDDFDEDIELTLRELVSIYQEEETEDSYFDIIRRLAEMIREDASVLTASGKKKGGIQYRTLEINNGRYLVLFSEPDSCSLYNEKNAFPISLCDLLNTVDMTDADGLAMDPDEDEGTTIIPRQIVMTLLAAMYD